MKNLKILRITGVAILLFAILFVANVGASPGKDADKPLTERTFIEVSQKALPAVVSIDVKKTLGGQINIPKGRFKNQDELRKFLEERGFPQDSFPFQLFPFSEQGEIEVPAAGSGVIIRPEGYVVTNYHVISDAKQGSISVKLNDDSVFEGDNVEVIGKDTFTDIAILKLKTDKKLPYLEFADSENAEIGQWVVALGNPLELKGSVSQGIISAKHRVIGKALLEDLFQTTAAINPGNSGGPLVDLEGKIVGINTAIATNTGLWQGVGFAIPSTTVKNVTDSIVASGKAKRGWLGIHMSELTPNIQKYYDLKDVQGIVVAKVIADSPADKAGIQTYDVITSVDGKKIKNRIELLQQIATKEVGSESQIELYRPTDKKAEKMTIKVTLGERPSDEKLGEKPAEKKEQEKEKGYEDLGIRFKDKDAKDISPGLAIDAVKDGSPAEKAGFQTGDILLEVNRGKVNSLDDFRAALKGVKDEKSLLLMYSRGNEILFSTIEK
jgi:serine protease Do